MEEGKIEKIDAMFDKIESISKEIKKKYGLYWRKTEGRFAEREDGSTQ